jgi:hypothetical protein
VRGGKRREKEKKKKDIQEFWALHLSANSYAAKQFQSKPKQSLSQSGSPGHKEVPPLPKGSACWTPPSSFLSYKSRPHLWEGEGSMEEIKVREYG